MNYGIHVFSKWVVLATLLVWGAPKSLAQDYFTIEVVNRHLFGPGPFPDQQLKAAWIRELQFDNFLNGKVTGGNNLGVPPNVSGEALQGKSIDGKLSDGTLINEHIDMSNAVIMNGQFNLLLAAVFGGPNKGDTFFYLDNENNWWIKDDIAIDPGFAAGIVSINDFTFTTGPRIIPSSVQTEKGYPGGTNQIGSLTAGRISIGRLGDSNNDGYLDGIFNAIGQFPLTSIFLPGAPFVQLFEFTSDIPISPLEASFLTTANTRSYLKLLKTVKKDDAAYQDIEKVHEMIKGNLTSLKTHINDVVKDKSHCDSSCQKTLAALSRTQSSQSNELSKILENAYKLLKQKMLSKK